MPYNNEKDPVSSLSLSSIFVLLLMIRYLTGRNVSHTVDVRNYLATVYSFNNKRHVGMCKEALYCLTLLHW